MAEYLAKLLNERHTDRRVIEDVLEEYLFNSGRDNDSDNETSDRPFKFTPFSNTPSHH